MRRAGFKIVVLPTTCDWWMIFFIQKCWKSIFNAIKQPIYTTSDGEFKWIFYVPHVMYKIWSVYRMAYFAKLHDYFTGKRISWNRSEIQIMTFMILFNIWWQSSLLRVLARHLIFISTPKTNLGRLDKVKQALMVGQQNGGTRFSRLPDYTYVPCQSNISPYTG